MECWVREDPKRHRRHSAYLTTTPQYSRLSKPEAFITNSRLFSAYFQKRSIVIVVIWVLKDFVHHCSGMGGEGICLDFHTQRLHSVSSLRERLTRPGNACREPHFQTG